MFYLILAVLAVIIDCIIVKNMKNMDIAFKSLLWALLIFSIISPLLLLVLSALIYLLVKKPQIYSEK